MKRGDFSNICHLSDMKHYIILVFSVLTLAAVAQAQNSGLPAVKVKTLKGKDVAFNSLNLNSDTAVIVSFWATWCVPCINELETIHEQWDDRFKETPFRLIAVSVDDARTSSRVKSLVAGKGWNFEVVLDPNSDLKRALNVNNIPHVLIIKNGKIIFQHSGYVPGNEDELFAQMKAK